MRDDNKRVVDSLSIIIALALYTFTMLVILQLMKQGYTRDFSPEEMLRYEFLLALMSIFSGVVLTILFVTIRGKVTKSKKTLSQMLKESDIFRSQLMAIQDFCGLLTIEIDSSFKIVYANKNAEEVFNKVDLLNCYLRTIISEDELSDDDILDILDGDIDSVHFRVRHNAGEANEKVLDGYITPIFEDKESIYIAQVLLRDVTYESKKDKVIAGIKEELELCKEECDEIVGETLRANDKLRCSVRILTETFIAAPVGLVIIDGSGYITNCNRAFENLFDYYEKDLVGKQVDVLYANRDITEDILRRVESGENVMCEVDCLRSDLSNFVGMLKIKPVYDDRHNIIKYILSINDITKRTKLHKLILLKNQELLSVNEIFISTNQYNSLEKKLNVFLDKLFDNLEVIRKGLVYLKKSEDSLELLIYKGFQYMMVKELTDLSMTGSLCGHSLTEDKVILSEMAVPEEHPGAVNMLSENGVSDNHIYLPITYKDKPLGVLIIFPNKSYQYENTDIEFFDMIRSELGVCIKQALKYEELKEKVTSLAGNAGV
jgi:PAS domain S-box-containing protein